MDKFEKAMRILGFGDGHCTTEDPEEYARKWLKARLAEDIARSDLETKMQAIKSTMGAANHKVDHLRSTPSVSFTDLRGVPDEDLTPDQLRWREMSRGRSQDGCTGNMKA